MPGFVWFEDFEHNKFLVLNVLRKFDYFATVDDTYGWKGNIKSQYILPPNLIITTSGEFQGKDLSQHAYEIAKRLDSTDEAIKRQSQIIIDNLFDFCVTPKKGYTALVLDAILQYIKRTPACQVLLYRISVDENIYIAANFGFDKAQLLLQHILTALQDFDAYKVGNSGIRHKVKETPVNDDIRYEAVAINPLVRYLRAASFFASYATTYRHSDKVRFNLDLIPTMVNYSSRILNERDEWHEPFATLSKHISHRDFRIKLLTQWLATALAMVSALQQLHAENKIHCNLFCKAEKDHFTIHTAFRQNLVGVCKILLDPQSEQAKECVQLVPGQEYFEKQELTSTYGIYGSVSVPVAPETAVKIAGKYRFTQATDIYALGAIFEHYLLAHVAPLMFYNFVHDEQVYKLIDDLYVQVIKPMRNEISQRATLETCKQGLISFQATLAKLSPTISSNINTTSEQLVAAIVADDFSTVRKLLTADSKLISVAKISLVSLAKTLNRREVLLELYKFKQKVTELRHIKLPDNPGCSFAEVPGVDLDYDAFAATVCIGGIKDSRGDNRFVLAYHLIDKTELNISIGGSVYKQARITGALEQHLQQKTFYTLCDFESPLRLVAGQDAVIYNNYFADGSDQTCLYVAYDLHKSLDELKTLAIELNAKSLEDARQFPDLIPQVFGIYKLTDICLIASHSNASGSITNHLGGKTETIGLVDHYAANLFTVINLVAQPIISSGARLTYKSSA